jgi:hypothetical protein
LRRLNCKPAMPLSWQLAVIFVLGCFAVGILHLWLGW